MDFLRGLVQAEVDDGVEVVEILVKFFTSFFSLGPSEEVGCAMIPSTWFVSL